MPLMHSNDKWTVIHNFYSPHSTQKNVAFFTKACLDALHSKLIIGLEVTTVEGTQGSAQGTGAVEPACVTGFSSVLHEN